MTRRRWQITNFSFSSHHFLVDVLLIEAAILGALLIGRIW